MTIDRLEKLKQFCSDLKIDFYDYELLNLAFRHKSFTDEHKDYAHLNNERLEFLGDSILEVSTAYYLYKNIKKSEGDLARIKSAAVSEETLFRIAKKYRFNELILLGQGEEMSGGRYKKALLADCVEAVFGAYFLDSGFDNALRLIESLMSIEIDLIQQDKGFMDYKTELQEYCQKILHRVPKYEVVGQSGPDHSRVYDVIVHVIDKVYGPAQGHNKKEAEHNVAKMAMEIINKENESKQIGKNVS